MFFVFCAATWLFPFRQPLPDSYQGLTYCTRRLVNIALWFLVLYDEWLEIVAVEKKKKKEKKKFLKTFVLFNSACKLFSIESLCYRTVTQHARCNKPPSTLPLKRARSNVGKIRAWTLSLIFLLLDFLLSYFLKKGFPDVLKFEVLCVLNLLSLHNRPPPHFSLPK